MISVFNLDVAGPAQLFAQPLVLQHSAQNPFCHFGQVWAMAATSEGLLFSGGGSHEDDSDCAIRVWRYNAANQTFPYIGEVAGTTRGVKTLAVDEATKSVLCLLICAPAHPNM